MLVDEAIIDAFAAGGTGVAALRRVVERADLRSDEELHLAYVPIGDSTLGDWESAAHRSQLRTATQLKSAVVVTGRASRSKNPVCIAVVPQPATRLMAVVGVGRRFDFREVYERIWRNLYAGTVRPYFRQYDFAATLHDIAKQLGKTTEVYLTRVSARKWLTKQTRETSITWTELPYRQILEEASERGHFFYHVSFEARVREAASTVYGGISRPNIVSLSVPATLRLGEMIDKRLVRHATEEFKLLTDRSRVEPRTRPRPILAKFDEAIAVDDAGVRQVTDLFRQYKRSSIAVIHGNPYLHVRLVDLDDGSSYAVFMTSGDAMMLVPQLRSSESSFGRLLEFVHDSFGAAEFKDAPRTYA